MVLSLPVIVISLGMLYLSYQKDNANQNISEIEQQLDQMKKAQMTIKNMELIPEQKRMEIKNRHEMFLNLLKSLGSSYEENVCFTQIAHQKNKIDFAGKTRSIEDLTRFLLNWQQEFPEIQIDKIEKSSQEAFLFHLRIHNGPNENAR